MVQRNLTGPRHASGDGCIGQWLFQHVVTGDAACGAGERRPEAGGPEDCQATDGPHGSRSVYPSAHLKRIQTTEDWWEARVNDDYRFGLKLIDGIWTFLVVGDHRAILGK